MQPVRLARNAIGPVKNGHPWVYRDGNTPSVPTGALVSLRDGDNEVAWGIADEGPIAFRVLGTDSPVPLERMLPERIGRADNLRLRLVDPDTDCMRIVNAAGDGLPGLVIDRYGSLAVLRIYSTAWVPHLDTLVGAITRLHWVETVARRLGVSRVDDDEGLVCLAGPEVPETLVVREYGMKLLVRPHVGQKTGLFLDQREHRNLIRRWAPGRIVANLFAYNGGFSVAAALGGAAHVTTVDIAPAAIDDARETFRLNDLDPDQHRFEVADVFEWTPQGAVDLLIVDPPSLARGARSDVVAAKAYRKLHRRLGPFVSKEGLLASASCTARLDRAAWQRAIREGLRGDWSWHWLSEQPPDHPTALGHPEGRYLKFALLRRRS